MTDQATLINTILQLPDEIDSSAALPAPAELVEEIARLAGAADGAGVLEKKLLTLGHKLDFLRGDGCEIWKRDLRSKLDEGEGLPSISWPPQLQALERELDTERQRLVLLSPNEAGVGEALSEVTRLEDEHARLLARRAVVQAALDRYPEPST